MDIFLQKAAHAFNKNLAYGLYWIMEETNETYIKRTLCD